MTEAPDKISAAVKEAASSQSWLLRRTQPGLHCLRPLTHCGPSRPAALRHQRKPFSTKSLSVTRQLAVFQIAIIRWTELLPVLHQAQACFKRLDARVLPQGAQLGRNNTQL